MKRIAVIGAGSMGSGIAQVAAMAGHEVILYDSYPNANVKARDAILTSLNKLSSKGKISDQESKNIFGRIFLVENLESIAESDLIVEAIIEDEEEKKKTFVHLETLVDSKTIIATNTSSLSITALATSLKRPERFIGIHFFNPPVMMRLVEIIPALQTSTEIIQTITDLVSSWDKVPVKAKDTPGFIVNRIARPYYGEALRIVEERLASPELVDKAMKDEGFKMGPFELMDFIGNDINEAVTRSVWTALHFDSRYKPSTLQGSMVRAGWLGRKSGRGFYNYTEQAHSIVQINGINEKEISTRILAMLINEAADALYLGIASRDDIDQAMVLGVNYPKGLLKWADEIGIKACVDQIDALHDMYHEDRYRCSAGLRKMATAKHRYY